MKLPRLNLNDPRGSLVGRLVLLAAVWCVALLIAAGVVLSAYFHQAAIDRVDQTLSEDADDLYSGISIGPDGQVYAPAITDVRATRAYSGKYWEIAELRPDGRLHTIGENRSRSFFDAEDLPAPQSVLDRLKKTPDARLYYDGDGPHSQPLRIALMRRFLPGRAAPVMIMTAEDRETIDRAVQQFAVTTALGLLLLGAGLVAAVVAQVRIGLHPLFAMRRDIADVRGGKRERLTRPYPSELQPVADELNALLDHNQEVVERQRTHVGNLAHALKTPLSAMLIEADSHPGPLAVVVRRQAEAMQGHVEHHLRRARAAARSQARGERTPVAPVLEEIGRTLERIYRKLDLDVDPGPADLVFAGERQDLMEIIGNILENACKWARTSIAAHTAPEGPRWLLIVVEDDGPGLPAERREEVLKRGARLDESAPGSGLGLSIVDELTRAYGGQVILGDSDLGGLKVTLRLPRMSH
jgi:signal transduction histidine kinase